MMKEYVLGFLFDKHGCYVALLKKQRPEWQRGLLNGMGGHIESGESPIMAMQREAKEEAGVFCQWIPFAEMAGDDFKVYCFKSFNNTAIADARSLTDEEIDTYAIGEIKKHECISNLPWLVHMALDNNDGRPFYATVNYSK